MKAKYIFKPKTNVELSKLISSMSQDEKTIQLISFLKSDYEINDETIIKLLLKNRVNVNLTYGDGQATALMYACDNPYITKNIVEILIKAGANVNAQKTNGLSSLYCTVRNNNLELTKLLVNSGADINIKTIRDVTPLIKACQISHSCHAMIRFLVLNGADVNAVSDNGYAALRWAYSNEDNYVIKFLKEHGAEDES